MIGAGKFALEVTRYIDDVLLDGGSRAYRVLCYLAVAGEPALTPADRTFLLTDFDQSVGVAVVLAVSDVAERRSLIDGFINKHGLPGENILHPDSRVDGVRIEGTGNIVGPHCYLGADVSMGSYNVVNYHCTVGHHSTLGSNNFIGAQLQLRQHGGDRRQQHVRAELHNRSRSHRRR